MSSEVEQLAQGVGRVSLGTISREEPVRNPNFMEGVEDIPSFDNNSDVDMSDSPSVAVMSSVITGEGSTEVENSSYNRNGAPREGSDNDPSAKSSETSPVHLRRSGKSSLGLGKDFCDVMTTAFGSIAFHAISDRLSNKGTLAVITQGIGRLNLVLIALLQVISIFGLFCDLLGTRGTSRVAQKIATPLKRGHASRDRSRGSGWNLSVADKVDNWACKLLIILSLIATRIFVIILCIFFLSLSTKKHSTLIEAAEEKLIMMMGGTDVFSYGDNVDSTLHANVLQECKTVPEPIFENQYICT